MRKKWWPLKKKLRTEDDKKAPRTEGEWTDTEIDDIAEDSFVFQDYVEVLVERVTKANTPLTIGIFGRWGSGKTSLMRLTKAKLSKETKNNGRPRSIWINTKTGLMRLAKAILRKETKNDGQPRSIWISVWQLSNRDEVWHAFLQALFSEVRGGLSLWHRIDKGKLLRQLISNSYRIVLVITPMIVGLLIVKPEAGWEDVASLVLSPIAGAGTLVTVGLGLWTLIKPIVEAAREIVSFDLQAVLKDAPYEAQVTELMKLRKRFEGMVKTLVGEGGRLVVFVDDLDRCAPDKVPEVLEAIKLFATVPHCVYVLGLDHEIIRQGIEKKYEFETETEAVEYLEKIVQIPFHLPPLEGNRIKTFIEKEYPEVNIISPTAPEIFSLGLEPNPRKTKRTLNIYRMFLHLADIRWKNFEMDHRINPELLAKIVIIQTRFRDLYEVLVRDPSSIKVLVAWARVFNDPEWYSKTSHKQEITGEFLAWLKEQVRDPEMAKRVREGSKLLEELEPEAFNVDPALARMLMMGAAHTEDLKLDELNACIYLTGTAESAAGRLHPSREERNVLLGGDETEIKTLVDEILSRGRSDQDRKKDKQTYVKFLEEVLTELKRGTAAKRVSANTALDLLERWERKDFEPQTVRIPAGKFLMGSGDEQLEVLYEEDEDIRTIEVARSVAEHTHPDEYPQHSVELSEYRISIFPVTNREYQAFIEATDYQSPSHWKGSLYPMGKENHPVVNVSWEDANAYCHWLTGMTRRRRLYRLPTEAEWEKAARGTDGRVYPWGNEWDPSKLNSEENGPGDTTPVGQFSPQGDSPYGVADMAGNVWEWCGDWYDEKEYKRREGKDVKDPRGPDVRKRRAQRGGSFFGLGDRVFTRCTYRGRYHPSSPSGRDVGFRVVFAEWEFFERQFKAEMAAR